MSYHFFVLHSQASWCLSLFVAEPLPFIFTSFVLRGKKYYSECLKMELQQNNRNLASLVESFGIYSYLDNAVCFYHCIYQPCLA